MGTDGGHADDGARGDGARRDVDRTADESMRERAGESRVKLYVLLEANRWIVTGALLAFVFASLLAVGGLAPVALRQIVAAGDPVGTLFQALVTAIITGVTLVVTITQLVVSQELGPLGDQRERMEGAMSFRTDAADVLDVPVSPLEPAEFLAALVDAAGANADRLSGTVGNGGGQAESRAVAFAEALARDANQVGDRLADAEFGTYDLLSAALDFNYSVKIYDARRLVREHGDALPAEATEALEDVVGVLTMFAPAREHVKTLYFQWELTNLSREILYATVPALLVAMVGVLYLDTTGTITGATLGLDNLVWVVSAAATVAVAPFALLVAYVLRIATVAKRTLAIGPFVLRTVDRSAGIDWDDRE